MAANPYASNRRMATSESFILDGNRRAHRVFRSRPRGLDILNPFRHIAWVSESQHKDTESGREQQPLASHHGLIEAGPPIFKLGKFKVKCLEPAGKEPFTIGNQLKRTFLTSWVNVFLLCVPVGICLGVVRGGSPETFAVNYLAEIPLWFMCDYALEEMEKYIGITTSDLLDIFTSNTVQIISSVVLLKAGQVSLLQTSLIGGILSNILVLLGLSVSFGGKDRREQEFNRTGAQGSSSLLSIAATSLLIPTAAKQLGQTTENNLVMQSRGVSVILLFVYFTYTFCQMVTHKTEYRDSGKSTKQAGRRPSARDVTPCACFPTGQVVAGEDGVTEKGVALFGTQAAVPAFQPVEVALADLVGENKPRRPVLNHLLHLHHDHHEADDEIRGPQLHIGVSTVVFAATIVALYFCIDYTVGSISALTQQTALSPTFVGLVLLPIPNCDFAPISLAVDDRLEQTMKYTVGRSIQTALLVEPLVVLLAWWMRVQGVTLAFDGFEVVSLFTTILLLNFLVVDAKVHWVHGILLLADWVLIGIAAYFVEPEALG